jgi:hypothetical protein
MNWLLWLAVWTAAGGMAAPFIGRYLKDNPPEPRRRRRPF